MHVMINMYLKETAYLASLRSNRLSNGGSVCMMLLYGLDLPSAWKRFLEPGEDFEILGSFDGKSVCV